MADAPDRYAAIARMYDFATGRVLETARQAFLALCKTTGVSCVLDIGCGTGMLAAYLAQGGIAVTAVDTSPSMLAIARKRFSGAAGAPVTVMEATMPFPFANEHFDAALLALVLHETEADPAALLREALRVAQKVFVLEWKMPERNIDYCLHPLVHAIERAAGKEHYAAFKRYARNGWLRGLAADADAVVESERFLYMSTITLATLRRKGDSRG